MVDEYKWKLIYQGKKLNKNTFLFQKILKHKNLDSGPHDDHHKCGGTLYTYLRASVEQTFLLAGEEDL